MRSGVRFPVYSRSELLERQFKWNVTPDWNMFETCVRVDGLEHINLPAFRSEGCLTLHGIDEIGLK